MTVLGLSCYFHDSAAVLYRDGEIVAAAEEERFTRVKHDARFPERASAYCLAEAGITIDQVDAVVFHEKPLRKLDRILRSCIDGVPVSFPLFVGAMRSWMSEKVWVPSTIHAKLRYRGEVLYLEHHLSHAASAYLVSPFEEAAVLTIDGVGERTTASVGIGEGASLRILKEIEFPHSLGLLYSAITAFLGFEVNEGEYKVMGLAAYGQPRYLDEISRLIRLQADGSFRLDLRYFDYHRRLRVWRPALEELLGSPRLPEGTVDERHADIAASLQVVLADAVVALASEARRETGSDNLAFAGGVALNVVANREVLRRSGIRALYVPPAPGDSGAALGAAAYVSHCILGAPRRGALGSAYLGPAFDAGAIRTFLEREGIAFVEDDAMLDRVAALIAAGNVVGWFHGRMEFGPRALGARSILADPTRPEMKDIINVKVKHREPFRPFAPAVHLEDVGRYFVDEDESPFMLLVTDVRPEQRASLPAITHVDGTARVQTVRRETSPLFYDLITRIGGRTGVPMVLNTSFNLRGEPIVCTPEDAFRTFCSTDLDALVLWPFLVPASSKRSTTIPLSQPREEVWLS